MIVETELGIIFLIVIAGTSLFWIATGFILDYIYNSKDDEIKEKSTELQKMIGDLQKRINTLEIESAQHRFMFLYNQLSKTEQNKFRKNNPIREVLKTVNQFGLMLAPELQRATWDDTLKLELKSKEAYEYLIKKLEELEKSKEIYKKYKGESK